MKIKLWFVAAATFVLLVIVLAYGSYIGRGYCGPILAVLWGIASAVFHVLWGLKQGQRREQVSLTQCWSGDHEYFWEEIEEVLAWHTDIPVWCKMKVKRCCKCDHEEERDIQA